jgi:Mn2+/Fe2+ NRAMP family transporter
MQTAPDSGTPAPQAPPPETFDPYVLSPQAVQDPPKSLGQALRQIGPGLILAGSIVGTGELIATTHLGAKAGFTLLWLVIVSCFIKVFVQVELGRYAVSSGETTLESLRRLPGPGVLLPWWWLFMVACTQFQLGTMVGGVAQTGHMVFPGVSEMIAGWFGGPGSAAGDYLARRGEVPWAVFTAIVTSVLLAAGSYKHIERATTTMVVVFTLMTVGCVVLLPAAGHPVTAAQLAEGFSFQLPVAAITAAVAMFGITGVGASELIMYPYWCIEKGYGRNVGPRPADPVDPRTPPSAESEAWLARARGWMRVMRLDAWVSMIVYTIATLAFFLLGAAVLYGHTAGGGLPGDVGGMMSALRQMYVPVLGGAASTWFIVIGTFAVLYSTLFAATASNCRTVTDFLRINNFITVAGHDDRMRWVRRFCIAFPFLNLAIFIWIGNPVTMVLIGGVAQALTLPMIATAAVFLRYARTDKRLMPGLAWDVFLLISMLALYAVAAIGVYDVYKRLTAAAA